MWRWGGLWCLGITPESLPTVLFSVLNGSVWSHMLSSFLRPALICCQSRIQLPPWNDFFFHYLSNEKLNFKLKFQTKGIKSVILVAVQNPEHSHERGYPGGIELTSVVSPKSRDSKGPWMILPSPAISQNSQAWPCSMRRHSENLSLHQRRWKLQKDFCNRCTGCKPQKAWNCSHHYQVLLIISLIQFSHQMFLFKFLLS